MKKYLISKNGKLFYERRTHAPKDMHVKVSSFDEDPEWLEIIDVEVDKVMVKSVRVNQVLKNQILAQRAADETQKDADALVDKKLRTRLRKISKDFKQDQLNSLEDAKVAIEDIHKVLRYMAKIILKD